MRENSVALLNNASGAGFTPSSVRHIAENPDSWGLFHRSIHRFRSALRLNRFSNLLQLRVGQRLAMAYKSSQTSQDLKFGAGGS